MKPFIVLLFFITFLILFAGAAMGNNNVSPNTLPVSGRDGSLAPATQGGYYSSCSDPYIVRPGNTLSGISRLCGVTLADLLAVNPGISNPDLIQIGQQVRIPGAYVPQVVQPAPITQPTPAPAGEVQPIPAPTEPVQPDPAGKSLEQLELEAFQTASAP